MSKKKVDLFGLGFGNGFLSEGDWIILQKYVEKYNIKTVLEFGCGFSTYLFDAQGCAVTSLENKKEWADIINPKLSENSTVNTYKYPNFPVVGDRYDMSFVDGPTNSHNGRKDAMVLASSVADMVFVDDSSRQEEKKALKEVFPESEWSRKYFSGGLTLCRKREPIPNEPSQ